MLTNQEKVWVKDWIEALNLPIKTLKEFQEDLDAMNGGGE